MRRGKDWRGSGSGEGIEGRLIWRAAGSEVTGYGIGVRCGWIVLY